MWSRSAPSGPLLLLALALLGATAASGDVVLIGLSNRWAGLPPLPPPPPPPPLAVNRVPRCRTPSPPLAGSATLRAPSTWTVGGGDGDREFDCGPKGDVAS